MRDLRPTELAQYLDSALGSPLLVDVREHWEFDICHLPDSKLVPMQDIPTNVSRGQLPLDRDIVVICHHGVRSRHVASYLEHHGYQRVINLAGGVDAWAREVDRNMPTY